MADNQKAPESKFVPPSQVDPAALAEAFEKEGLVSKPPPAATSAPAEPPKVEEKKPEAKADEKKPEAKIEVKAVDAKPVDAAPAKK